MCHRTDSGLNNKWLEAFFLNLNCSFSFDFFGFLPCSGGGGGGGRHQALIILHGL